MAQEAPWYTKTAQKILEELGSSSYGLTQDEAARRLAEYGPNVLPEAPGESLFSIFVRQFESPLIYVLLVASAIVFALGDYLDGLIILFVLFFNASVGTIQEGRAQNTLRALKRFAETKATVLRESKELIIPDTELVPGDLILLAEGEKVPADARVMLSRALRVDEASLTGESESVYKIAEVLRKPFADATEQKNMLFKGTHVVAGSGTAVVVAVGERTVIGSIAQKLAGIDTEIPLKTDIRRLSRVIIAAVVALCVFLFILGTLKGIPMSIMFVTVVALAVSVIPEGLPIVITLVLATGVWRMSKRHALIKRLQAVEALGQARVIAVDKTGTLTKNEPVIQKVYVNGNVFEVGGVGYETTGDVRRDGAPIDPPNHEDLLYAGKIATWCANARVMYERGQWRVMGDPTEAALLVFAEKLGFHKEELERETPLLSEIPFDYKHKFHATLHQTPGGETLTVIGAPEEVLKRCKYIYREGAHCPPTDAEYRELHLRVEQFSKEGLRVLAGAVRMLSAPLLSPGAIEELAFVALFGMKDALRGEVPEALERAARAGVRVVMITGDHVETARAIGYEAGIFQEGDELVTGETLEKLSPKELSLKLPRVSVFARVTPEHKLRIIEAYRARGELIAMTGDGVNDAPSLVAADLGVAMGGIGTEVAKEAADIVLLDDNFGSIVSAIEEGRNIYKTIKRVILYLFSTSVGEAATIVGALLIGLPLPILPGQIIWLNFVTDPFLDVALAMEPKEKGLLMEGFERPKKYLVDSLMLKRMIYMALPMTLGVLILFSVYAQSDLSKALTLSLTTLAVFQWFNAWNCRSDKESIFTTNPFSNKFLLAATGIVVLLQALAVYTPFMHVILHTTPLSWGEWLLCIAIAFSIVVVEETRKFLYRRRHSVLS